ncbi:MAG: zinc-ribbon domain containing protein [candidate division KSB1 bacterium]|nr:zinc-ribbon domain containing protein [candidate division KSB1 bacterium]MDZ7318537.1 zinc-ribbon domain containing protein [candidate division KSB1 bacterium]MDZ7342304.1 zinc-ribbon domain containing protein [candidate division KSB1 bacterium]
MDKITRLRQAANEFAGRAQAIDSVQEVALFGSLAKGDPYPKDIDLAVILSGLDKLPALAKAARKMSPLFHNWDVFVFDSRLNYVGRLCHSRECPAGKAKCIGCGDIPYIQHKRGFKFTPEDFYSSPFQTLFNRQRDSQFIRQREAFGIAEDRSYEQFEDIVLECWECGNSFVFTGGEQKYYQQHGLRPPKRCEDCREKQQMLQAGLYDYDETARFETP